jgi:hypothetical protein
VAATDFFQKKVAQPAAFFLEIACLVAGLAEGFSQVEDFQGDMVPGAEFFDKTLVFQAVTAAQTVIDMGCHQARAKGHGENEMKEKN